MRSQLRNGSRSSVSAIAILVAGALLLSSRPGLLRVMHAQHSEVAMFVSVLDSNGAPVPGLSANEFVVRENGVRREVLRVSQPATDPIDIALVVDNTAASTAAMQDIRKAVTTFVDAMHTKHFISLVTYADRPTIFAPYTHDLAQLQAGIGRLFAIEGSGSYLLDALVELSQGLAKRKAERAAIIVLSTDGPELGNYNYNFVLEALAEGGASLNAIVVNPKAGATANDATRNRMILLDRGPRESGGVRTDVVSSMALDGRLALLATQLANQYRVVYSRPESIIPPDKFAVSVTRPDLEAHGTPARRQSR